MYVPDHPLRLKVVFKNKPVLILHVNMVGLLENVLLWMLQEYRRQSGNQRRIYERSGVNSRNISRSNVSRLTDSGTFRRLGIGQDRSSSALQPLARHLENKALSPIHQTPPHQPRLLMFYQVQT